MTNTPKLLHDAMKYSIDAGGKRIRPCLTLGVCDILGGNRKYAIRLGSGIEMIHTYSLIHDDLPCMDNDDMRRGKPSNHMVFGEAQALLAGDGLLTYAFEWMLEAGIDSIILIIIVQLRKSLNVQAFQAWLRTIH